VPVLKASENRSETSSRKVATLPFLARGALIACVGLSVSSIAHVPESLRPKLVPAQTPRREGMTRKGRTPGYGISSPEHFNCASGYSEVQVQANDPRRLGACGYGSSLLQETRRWHA